MKRKRHDDEFPLFMDRDDLAEFTGYSEDALIQQILSNDSFPKVKNGKRDRYPREAIIKWSAENWELLA